MGGKEERKIFQIAWSVTGALNILASGDRGRQGPSDARFWCGGVILASSACGMFIPLHAFGEDNNRTLNRRESWGNKL